MATNDIKVYGTGGLSSLPTRFAQVAASATIINPGEPVKLLAQTSGAGTTVVKLVDGDGVIGTTTQVVGITKGASTNTSSVAGVVEVYLPNQNTIFAAQAKSATAANTLAKIVALESAMCLIDLTSSVFTIDTAVNSNTYGFQIVGGDPTTNTVYFQIRSKLLDGLDA